MKPLIVGIDPGSTSAVALLDTEGEVVAVRSGKNFPPRDMISYIVERGTPIIVSSDKRKMPSKVEKVANSTGSTKFSPAKDLKQGKKNKMAEGDNSHERDAVASAIHAFKQERNTIEKLKRKARSRDQNTAEAVKNHYLDTIETGDKDSSNEETSKSEEQEENIDIEKYRRKNSRLEKKVENLEEQVESLKEELEQTEDKKKELRKKYEELREGKRDEILKQREVSKREGRLKEKQKRIEELEEKLENSYIREKQYEEALSLVENGGIILPIAEEREEIPENVATRSMEIKKQLEQENFRVVHVDEVEGVELLERVVVEEIPEKNFRDVIKGYRESR